MLGKNLIPRTIALIKARKIVDLKLSPIECRIVNELQTDGLAEYSVMAEEFKFDRQKLRDRTLNLQRVGCIRGYHADINYPVAGYKLIFYVIITLENSNEEKLKEYEDLIVKWPNLRECNMISAGGDFLLKFLVRDKPHMDQLTLALTAMPNINNVLTLPIVYTIFDRHGVPFEGLTPPPPLKTVFGGGKGHRHRDSGKRIATMRRKGIKLGFTTQISRKRF